MTGGFSWQTRCNGCGRQHDCRWPCRTPRCPKAPPPTCSGCSATGWDLRLRDHACEDCRAPRLGLVAHIRDQIEADPEAYANPRKLEATAARILEELRRAGGSTAHGEGD